MVLTNNFKAQPIRPALLGKRMLLGAGIGLILISVFLIGVKNPNPAWGKFWMIKPLIIVPLAGAGGGAFYYFINHFWGYQGGWRKAFAIVFSLVGFIIALWLGTVLGLNGTLWN